MNTKNADARKDRRNGIAGVLPEKWLSKAHKLRVKSHACTCSIVSKVLKLETCKPWKVSGMKCFKRRLSLIVRVNVVLNRTVIIDSDWRLENLCGSHLQSQSELYRVSWWYYTLVIDLISQLRRDVIGRLSVKPWCYWLWRLVISNWCVSIRLLSQLNSRLLLVKLSVL